MQRLLVLVSAVRRRHRRVIAHGYPGGPSLPFEQHESSDAEGVAADVGDVDIAAELPDQTVNRFVCAFLRRPRTMPVEELFERQTQVFVAGGGLRRTGTEALEQAGEPVCREGMLAWR